jgi:hypothetical protein
MSSEWWSILAVFWGLYLADGLRGGRRDRLFFHDWRGWGRAARARVSQSSWFFTPPLPGAWMLTTEDLPASLAPEGLTNWPCAAASRPPVLPEHVEAWGWEDVRRVDDRLGWIYVNERRFTPSTPGLDAASLGNLARELSPLSIEARAARLRLWHSRRFASHRFARRLKSALLRSRGLARLNTTQTTLLAIVSAYLLLDGPARVQPALRDALAGALPLFLSLCAGLHLLALGWFYCLHRRFHPRAGQERASLIFTALLVPPQALRMRMHLVAKLGAGLHPLSVALACAGPATARSLATATLRDLRWPRLPADIPPRVEMLVRSASVVLEPFIHAALNRHGAEFSSTVLLAAPVRRSPEACAYCPRCGDEFTRPDSVCPHGVPLSRF